MRPQQDRAAGALSRVLTFVWPWTGYQFPGRVLGAGVGECAER